MHTRQEDIRLFLVACSLLAATSEAGGRGLDAGTSAEGKGVGALRRVGPAGSGLAQPGGMGWEQGMCEQRVP